jgi:DNA-binding transcriptional LysR family regulator
VVRAVIKHRNVTEAARELGISQPAVSQHLARFEQYLGSPILVRHGNELLVKNEATAQALETLISGLDRLTCAVAASDGAKLRPKLGLSLVVADCLIGNIKLYEELSEHYQFIVAPSEVLSEMFGNAQLDLTFRALWPNERDVDLLCESELVWIGRRSDSYNIQPDERLPVVLGPPESINARYIENYLASQGIKYSVAAHIASGGTCIKLVKEGVGITAIPSFAIEPLLGSSCLARVSNLAPISDLCYGLYFHKKAISFSSALEVYDKIVALIDGNSPGVDLSSRRA